MLHEGYQKTDLIVLRRYASNVLYNDQKKPWLVFFTEETGEKILDGSVTTKEIYYYLFENTNGQWKFVKDFSTKSLEVNDKVVVDFLKARYGLEF